MQTDHVIAQCAWQSSFDQQSRATELQSFISQWSNSVLLEELEQCFNRLCPATQTWRIDTLEIDLGDIYFDELPQELSRRLRARLDEALERMLTHQEFSAGSKDNLRVLDQVASFEELVIWFLLNGTIPWWFKGEKRVLQILDTLMIKSARSFTGIVRNLGSSETVRKRLVRQLGDDRMHQVIRLLEPWHGDFICDYADNLFKLQMQRQIPASGSREFREVTWLTILTHLLIDRGTLFNTVSFVRANLLRTAQHYRLDYRQLLEQMYQAVQFLAPAGIITHRFFTAIESIYQSDHLLPDALAIEAEIATDYWAQFQTMLHGSTMRRHVGQESLALDELFSALAEQDAGRMAGLLRQEGKFHSVRKGILQHFSDAQLEQLVCVLEPQDHLFIVAHVHHTQALADLQHWGDRAIWEVLLAYLMAERGSHFNRRQLVHDTLQQVCKTHRFDYAQLLDILIHSVQIEHPSHHRFDLMAILRQLQDELPARGAAFDTHYRQQLLHYLQTGGDPAFGGAIADRLWSDYARSGPAAGRQSLVMLLCAEQLRGVSDSILSRRLLEMVGAAEFPRLLSLLEPEAGEFCASLAGSLQQWQKQAGLPSLAGVDIFELQAMLIQALPGFYQGRHRKHATFNLARFWRRFTALLAPQVDIRAFNRQLKHCLSQGAHRSNRSGSIGAILPNAGLSDRWTLALIDMLARQSSDTQKTAALHVAEVPDSAASETHWSQPQLFDALRQRLTKPGESDGIAKALCEVPLADLWFQLEQGDKSVISGWIARQPDKYHLLQLLSRHRDIQSVDRWLLAQLPAELNPPDETIKHWMAIVQQGGCWQGASAVLEAQLNEVFWAVSFDAASKNLPVAQLIVRMAACLCLRLDISLNDCVASFRNQPQLLQKTHWRNACLLMSGKKTGIETKAFPSAHKSLRAAEKDLSIASDNPFRQDSLAGYLGHARFIEIGRHLLQYGHMPSWVDSLQPIDLTRLLFDVFTVRPELLQELLENLQPAAMFRLSNIVPFDWLITAMHATAPQHKQNDIRMLEHFWRFVAQIALSEVSRQQRSALLFQLILKRWLNNDWAALETDRLTGDFFLQLMGRQSVRMAMLRQSLAPHLAMLPATLRFSLEKIIEDEIENRSRGKKDRSTAPVTPVRKMSDAIKSVQAQLGVALPMRIDNAGLVILQSFIGALFSRLGLTENNCFVSDVAQRRAVHFLQFLATGCCETQEPDLMLNKLLCGLELDEPVESGFEISAVEMEVCLSLLNSVIGYWGAIGSSSIDGFRGNWLVREGSLNHARDHWELIVDRRAYDVLLARAPFSYSVIKLPWMEMAIYVTWPA